MKKLISLCVLCLVFAGCCNLRVSTKGDLDFVTIENSCWKFCSIVPLVSGSPNYPNTFRHSWLTNTATLKDNIKLLDRTVFENNYAGYKNLISFRSEEEILFFLVVRTTYHTSAELIRNETEEAEE